jgi:hypothetical protein
MKVFRWLRKLSVLVVQASKNAASVPFMHMQQGYCIILNNPFGLVNANVARMGFKTKSMALV